MSTDILIDDLTKKLHDEKVKKFEELVRDGKDAEAGLLVFNDPIMMAHTLAGAIAKGDFEAAYTCLARIAYLLDLKRKKLESIKPQGEA